MWLLLAGRAVAVVQCCSWHASAAFCWFYQPADLGFSVVYCLLYIYVRVVLPFLCILTLLNNGITVVVKHIPTRTDRCLKTFSHTTSNKSQAHSAFQTKSCMYVVLWLLLLLLLPASRNYHMGLQRMVIRWCNAVISLPCARTLRFCVLRPSGGQTAAPV